MGHFALRMASAVALLVVLLTASSSKIAVFGFSTPSIGAPRITAFPTRTSHIFASVDDTRKTPNSEESSSADVDDTPIKKKRKLLEIHRLPKAAYRIYVAYVRRLWKETDVPARKKITNDKVRGAIRNMQHILTSNEYTEFSDACTESQVRLLKACDEMLAQLPKENRQIGDLSSKETTTGEHVVVAASSGKPVKKKKQRSVLFGAVMGGGVACWVFSGNYVFTGIFTLMTILGQLEYYRMIMNTGVYPARKISVVGASSMFLTALFAPSLHQICLPMFGLWAMIWFLTRRQSYSTIPEIASTFSGMFYLGYVPSFWVRVRLIGADMAPTRLYGFLAPVREYLKQRFGIFLPNLILPNPITSGAVFIFWSWLSLAFSDVGAYFVGRKFGKTNLGAIAPAAGATSPNKTVEGVIGGCLTSACLSIVGAWVQKWPNFVVTGGIHGVILGVLGLVGDLTASMLKRDAGIKDFGDLIPEHGGILDRVDSFVWTAPYSWLVCAYIIPALKASAGG